MLYNKRKVTLEDYDEMVTIMESLAGFLENNYGEFYGVEEEINRMVKSFYDPKIEERGIEKGIERGIEKGIERGIEKGIERGIEEGEKKSNELLLKQISKRFGNISDEIKDKIMKLPISKVNQIGEAIFDFQSIEDLVKLI